MKCLRNTSSAVLFSLLFVVYNTLGAWSFQCYECNDSNGKSCTNTRYTTCMANENACWSGYGIMKNNTYEFFNRMAGCTQTNASSLATCGDNKCEKLREPSASTNITMPTCELTCCTAEKCNNPSTIPTGEPSAEPSAEPSSEPEAETTIKPENSSAITSQPGFFLLVVLTVPIFL